MSASCATMLRALISVCLSGEDEDSTYLAETVEGFEDSFTVLAVRMVSAVATVLMQGIVSAEAHAAEIAEDRHHEHKDGSLLDDG